MSKEVWTVVIASACIFWGVAVLVEQHRLSTLIPALGGYLLVTGVGLMVLFMFSRKDS